MSGIVDATGKLVEGAVKATTAVVGVGENAANLTSGVLKTGEAATDTAQQGLKTTAEVTDAAGKLTVGLSKNTTDLANAATNFTSKTTNVITDTVAKNSVESLGEQIKNTNAIITTLSGTTNDVLKSASPHVSGLVGKVLSMVSPFADSALKSINLGTTVFDSIINVVKSPFEAINGQITGIKNSSETPQKKLDAIKQAMINNFNKTITPELIKGFDAQLTGIISNIDSLIILYKQLGCQPGKIMGTTCSTEIQSKINIILRIQTGMRTKQTFFINEARQLFGQFNIKVASINITNVADENLETKIGELEKEMKKIQDEIIKNVTEKLNFKIEDFNDELNKINGLINALSGTLSASLTAQPPAGGKRRTRKSRRHKRSRKSKPHKRSRKSRRR